MPKRLKVHGPRPGPTTSELRKKRMVHNPSDDSKWAPTDPNKLTRQQKRVILSKVFKVAVRCVFKNHQYQFKGQTYRQTDGAPIGLRLTSIVARIVMDQWAAEFLVKTQDANINLHMFTKYVDDVNVILSMLKKGTRWSQENEVLEHTQEAEEEDISSGVTQEAVTMECVRQIADSIKPWLRFTSDLPENHPGGMVPILDLQVWVRHPDQSEEGLGSDLIGWRFFEKTSASSRVLRAASAYTWRSKITTLSMEVFRRLRNTSRQMTLEAKSDIIGEFIGKMRRSGYERTTVRSILQSGITFYYRKVRVDLEGGPRLNVRREDNTLQNRRAKLGGKETWFSRRRGGSQREKRKPRDGGHRVGTPGSTPKTVPGSLVDPGRAAKARTL